MMHTVKPVKTHNKIIFALLLAFIATCSFTTASYAEGISLSTYPSTLQLHAQPPTDLRSNFTIENKSETTVKLNIILKPFKADPKNDGSLIYTENNPQLFKKVQIVDNGFAVSTIELGPKQNKNLKLRVELSDQEKPADYYFSIVFLTADPPLSDEQAEDAVAHSNAQAGLALNVLLQVGPKELPRGYLEEFSTASFRNSGPVPFTLKMKNNGDHYFTPKGVILIKNIFGQIVGKIDLQNANILAGTGRSLVGIPYQSSAKVGRDDTSLSLPADPKDTASHIVWPEKFLLGIYRADLSVALSEEGPLFTQTISFVALPTNFLLGLGVAAIAIFLISLRIRRKLRES